MKRIYPDLKFYEDKPYDSSKPVHAAVEDCFADAWIELIRKDLGDEAANTLIVEDITEVGFDGGGMVRFGEPKASVKINDCEFFTFLRQIEFILPCLRLIQTNYQEELGPHVFVAGRWLKVLLTIETANSIIKAFEEEVKKRKDELEDEWKMYEKKVYEVSDPKNPKAFAPYRKQMHERNKTKN